ncbi:MAG: hypothetical protein JXA74_10100 [Anaerolineae bacterium]|nr:hypothetical protein [Anaerolineae bacterium]
MRTAQVDFDHVVRPWDGFGVNYVEACQTRDYAVAPQDYGGFSTLCEGDRQAILALIFGEAGLKPALIKMFLDPFHQAPPGEGYSRSPAAIDPSAYDHETTTAWMRYFVREGLARTRARGDDLMILTGLYGPPGWMTRQRFVRGRDLDPELKYECAKYAIAWTQFLREHEGLPVRYISLHNEGEDWLRWPLDGSTADAARHDYNLYWPPEQVVDFLRFMPGMLAAQGLSDVGVTPGETSNWYRFHHYGYADAIAEDPAALANLALITSHGFYSGDYTRWYGDHRSAGIDLLRDKRPELHAWVTSTSWKKMDVDFVNEIRGNIYAAKANGIIPWAAVQTTGRWIGGDPNPGTAIRVDGRGGYSVEGGYHYYKQVCRAGQAGMAIAGARCNDSEIGLIGFAQNGTRHPDALVLLNLGADAKPLDICLMGSGAPGWLAYRTGPGERYLSVGYYASKDRIQYSAPPRSVTTFFGQT